jgi:KRAB domain-containing zinc finger protein
VSGHLKGMYNVEHPFLCDICNNSFSWQSCRTKHEIVCNVDRPFLCNVCKKSLSFQGNLRVHLHTQMGERPFSCHMCKKIFQIPRCLKESSGCT